VGLKVTLHGRAERDLQDIIDHRAREHGALVAEHVHDELLKAMRRLALRPFLLGRPTATRDVRLLSLTRYPYRIYYTVTAVAVVILHIRHSARLDPDLSRLGHLHEDAAVYGVPAGGPAAMPRQRSEPLRPSGGAPQKGGGDPEQALYGPQCGFD
jgi:toxin ParE1/3/4